MKQIMTAAGILLALTGCTAHADNVPNAAAVNGPVVVELFQSQGCSSCPPANANLNALAGRSDVLALSYSVTYWDRLGWKDTFAKAEYTQRQRDYAAHAANFQVATPQVVINGRSGLIGDQAIAAAGPVTGGPKLELAAGKLTVGAAPARRAATVWLVRYDPREQQVAIRAGENGGRTLPHRNIVREFTKLGNWTGQPISLRVPAASDPVFRTAVLVQDGTGGPIIGARKL
jgi:hypothetical protein